MGFYPEFESFKKALWLKQLFVNHCKKNIVRKNRKNGKG